MFDTKCINKDAKKRGYRGHAPKRARAASYIAEWSWRRAAVINCVARRPHVLPDLQVGRGHVVAMAAASVRHFQPLKRPSEANITNFPDTFKDFFSRISESDDNDEVIVAMLEDKLIPRAGDDAAKNYKRHQMRRGAVPRRSFHRRSSEYHSRPSPETVAALPVSPAVARRRSSSIAVARQPPDLNRFLMAEQQRPWGHITPGPSSPSVRPVSPRGGRHAPSLDSGSYRSRTSSMPAVPRHRVSPGLHQFLSDSS